MFAAENTEVRILSCPIAPKVTVETTGLAASDSVSTFLSCPPKLIVCVPLTHETLSVKSAHGKPFVLTPLRIVTPCTPDRRRRLTPPGVSAQKLGPPTRSNLELPPIQPASC